MTGWNAINASQPECGVVGDAGGRTLVRFRNEESDRVGPCASRACSDEGIETAPRVRTHSRQLKPNTVRTVHAALTAAVIVSTLQPTDPIRTQGGRA